MLRHLGTRHWSCLSKLTDYQNSLMSGSKMQHSMISGHSSQPRINGRLSCTSSKCWGYSHSDCCACWRGMQLHCIKLAQSAMPCLTVSMVSCEHWLRRTQNGRKTCCSPWSLRNRSCLTIMLKRLQWVVWLSFLNTFSILSGSWDCVACGTRELILFLGWDILYYSIPSGHLKICGEWMLCQTWTCAGQ